MLKALLAMLVGLWIAGIGTDLFSTTSRFTFGRLELLVGIDFVVVAIGVFALGEVLASMEGRAEGACAARCRKACATSCRRSQDLKDCRFAFVQRLGASAS